MSKNLQMRKRKYPGCHPVSSIRGWMLAWIICCGCPCVLLAQEEDSKQALSPQPEHRPQVWGTDAFSGEELRTYHPTDLLKALQMAEPALTVPDHMQFYGSDPNHVPGEIQVRGIRNIQHTVSAAYTLPLIVVDGYEISVDRLWDFDMNRVKEVRILKDASASAIYGIRAANGVIEITTHAPKQGKIRLTYRFDGGVQSADISSYHLLGAREKLALEKKAGLYAGNETLYTERLEEIQKNGETNWLKIPLQVPFRHRHRLSVEGGDHHVAYMAYLVAAPGTEGVMKGSKRNLYNAGTRFQYTAGQLQVTNELKVDLNNGENSPYGNLLDYARINPYYAKLSALGRPEQILGEGTATEQYSPYYEASLSSFSKQKMTRVLNALNVSWEMIEGLRLTGSFTFIKDYNKQEQYISPNSSRFMGLDIDETELRGSYQIVRNNTTVYEEKLVMDYVKTLRRHSWQAGVGMHASAATFYSDNYTGVGIASDPMDYISFAKRYAFESRPGGGKTYDRSLSGLAYGRYGYADRYMADFSVRLDKSSLLAPDKQVACSWSANAAWNIHQEKWLQNCLAIDRMVLHIGGGMNAGHQFQYENVNPVYGYDIDNPYLNSTGNNHVLGLVTLRQLNAFNPALKWRKDENLNLGIKGSFFKRLAIEVGWYRTWTKQLATMSRAAAVTGFAENMVNEGSLLNTGWEFSLKATFVKTASGLSMDLLANGAANHNQLKGLPDYFVKNYNEKYFRSWNGNKLVNGNAVDGIYALRSEGIDPEDGKEIFLDKNGQKIKSAGIGDLVYMGSTTPDLSGNFGISASYHQWYFNCLFAYAWGGKYYNYTQSQRIDQSELADNGPDELLEKWYTPGQTAKYPGIGLTEALPTSRLVEDYNALRLASLYIGYQFSSKQLRRLRMEELKMGLTCNDLFYHSSVKMERGWMYPYAHNFNFSLQVTF